MDAPHKRNSMGLKNTLIKILYNNLQLNCRGVYE